MIVIAVFEAFGLVASLLAVVVVWRVLRRSSRVLRVTVTALLGILSHGSLAAGIVVASLLTWVRFDLMSLLFGDILTVTQSDILWVWLGGAAVMLGVAYLWRDLLALTVHEELAAAEGVRAQQVEVGFVLLIAVLIAIAMKIVGILLITALLIIPAAAARRMVRSPEGMAAVASLLGMIAVVAGVLQTAPTIQARGTSLEGMCMPERLPMPRWCANCRRSLASCRRACTPRASSPSPGRTSTAPVRSTIATPSRSIGIPSAVLP